MRSRADSPPVDPSPLRMLFRGFGVVIVALVVVIAAVGYVVIDNSNKNLNEARAERALDREARERQECSRRLAAEYDDQFADLLPSSSTASRDPAAISAGVARLQQISEARKRPNSCVQARRLVIPPTK